MVSSYSVARRASTNRRQLGFSMIELMLVATVMIILLAIAIPSVNGLGSAC
jgi:type II secretory pathway pseudopilin PulG